MNERQIYKDLLAKAERQLAESDAKLRKIAASYDDEVVEYRRVKHGIIGIQSELNRLKRKGSGLDEQ